MEKIDEDFKRVKGKPKCEHCIGDLKEYGKLFKEFTSQNTVKENKNGK